jgi:hypothetical protein
MKKIFTLLFGCSLLIQAHAQTANAVVYSEMGEKFTLYLNSEAQNEQAMSNVKIKGLTADYYQARIDFEDPTLPDFANSNFAVQMGMEVTYIVKKNKKGEYVLRYHGEASIGGSVSATSPEPAISDEVVRITEVEEEAIAIEDLPSDMQIDMNVVVPTEEVVQVTTTTTTTNGTGKPASTKTTTTNTDKVSMGINVDGVNMGVNIKVDESNVDMDMGVDVEESSSTTKTTTTTTKTTTTSKPAPAPATKPAPKPAAKPDVVVVESVAGCSKAMSAADFTGAKTSIGNKGFEDQKLSTAKMITKANCLTAAQIKEICVLFGFEETKLTFAKHAYDFCTDKGNYYVVNDVFNFSESTEELEQFISSK